MHSAALGSFRREWLRVQCDVVHRNAVTPGRDRLRVEGHEVDRPSSHEQPRVEGHEVDAVLRIKEDTERFGLSPLIKRPRDNKTPEIYRGYSASGRNMWVWVAAGVRIKGTGKTVKATRHTEVSVEYQALGLTRKQGESLALSISRTVSTIPKKASSSS